MGHITGTSPPSGHAQPSKCQERRKKTNNPNPQIRKEPKLLASSDWTRHLAATAASQPHPVPTSGPELGDADAMDAMDAMGCDGLRWDGALDARRIAYTSFDKGMNEGVSCPRFFFSRHRQSCRPPTPDGNAIF